MALNEQIKPVIDENLTVYSSYFLNTLISINTYIYIGDGIIFLFFLSLRTGCMVHMLD